jgi:Solitary outer membrane autotransporter beta-barrel domain
LKNKIPVRWTFSLLFVGWAARAQILPLPPGALQQLDTAIGQRVEATAVLGTQSVASRAGLGWKLNDAVGSIYRIPWGFELRDPTPLGDSGMMWTPEIIGGLGYGWFVNHFNNNALAGNESDFQTIALALGTGPRIYFGESGFSILPAFSLLYAYTENNFDANTPLGQQVAADGRYVNWTAQTMSFVPSFELQYKRTFGRWTPKVASDFAYFNTLPITSSTDALSFRSESKLWVNKLDLDYLTPWDVFDCPMHFGGDVSRTDVYQGLQGALGTDHFYQTNGRVTFDVTGRLLKFSSVGVSGGYFWCEAFTGYSIGLEASVKF